MILLPLNEKIPAAPSTPGERVAVPRPERLGGVLDERHAVAVAQPDERVEVGRLAVEVDGHERPRLPPAGGPRLQGVLDEVRVEVPRARLRVDEDGHAALVEDRVHARAEREVRDKHLVAALDADEPQREVERGRPRRDGHGVPRADVGGELGLEGVHVRADRRDPVGGERLGHESPFVGADVGGREVEAVGRLHGVQGRVSSGA